MADTHDVTISLSNIRNVKNILIEGLGEFKVRKIGAGEELDLSKRLRRLRAIINELNTINTDELRKKNPTEEEKDRLNKLLERTSMLMDELGEIKEFEYETYVRCFDDGGTGITKELLSTLSEEALANLFKQIFEPKVLDETPVDPITAEELRTGKIDA